MYWANHWIQILVELKEKHVINNTNNNKGNWINSYPMAK